MEIKIQQPEYDKPHIEEGVYKATLTEIRDIDPHPEWGDRIVLIFVVASKKPVEIGYVVNKKLTPNTKLGLAVQALGADLNKEVLDLSTLIGAECRVIVENYDDRDGDKRSGISKVKTLAEEEKTIPETTVIKGQ